MPLESAAGSVVLLPPHLAVLPPCCPAEYCSRGSLYDCLATAREQPAAAAQLTWPRRLAMAVDAAAGLFYLHRRGILHRDGENLLNGLAPALTMGGVAENPCVVHVSVTVKSPNLLVDEHWRVKVAGAHALPCHEACLPCCLHMHVPVWLCGTRPSSVTVRIRWNASRLQPVQAAGGGTP